jgi:hypothetical protein
VPGCTASPPSSSCPTTAFAPRLLFPIHHAILTSLPSRGLWSTCSRAVPFAACSSTASNIHHARPSCTQLGRGLSSPNENTATRCTPPPCTSSLGTSLPCTITPSPSSVAGSALTSVLPRHFRAHPNRVRAVVARLHRRSRGSKPRTSPSFDPGCPHRFVQKPFTAASCAARVPQLLPRSPFQCLLMPPAHAPVHAACPAHEPPRQLASARAFAPCLPSLAPTLLPPRAVQSSPAPAKPHPLCSASRPTLTLRRSHPRHSCAPPARTPTRAARTPALPPAGPHTRCLLQPLGPPARHLLRARRSLCLRLPRPAQRLPSRRRSPGATCSRGSSTRQPHAPGPRVHAPPACCHVPASLLSPPPPPRVPPAPARVSRPAPARLGRPRLPTAGPASSLAPARPRRIARAARAPPGTRFRARAPVLRTLLSPPPRARPRAVWSCAAWN